ncbi:MAG TPA: hypothetical protein PKO09_02415 [Anaerolineae bacterium]|nr:hypothetical protein [Anaerolineae bacterium]
MSDTYCWSRFYGMLCRHGPNLLLGIDDDTREIIETYASSTDIFWSEGLEDCLAEGAAGGSLRGGVLSALELWRENVLDALDTNFGIELDWELVSIQGASSLIDELVEAASPG